MKTILITGSGSGFGKAAALALAGRGHHVLATTHTDSDAKKLQKIATQKHLNLHSFVLDVTKPADHKKIMDYDIDVLINNAGMGETGSLAEIPVDKIRNNFEVNLFGPLELTQLALAKMIKKDTGTIIFISSLLGRITSPFFGPYSMTKFALSSGAEMLRNEIKEITKNVHVVVVEPGAYHTGFNQKMMNKKYEWMQENSYFFDQKNQMKTSETNRFHYTAPWWQAFFVRIIRMLGK